MKTRKVGIDGGIVPVGPDVAVTPAIEEQLLDGIGQAWHEVRDYPREDIRVGHVRAYLLLALSAIGGGDTETPR